MKLTRDFYLKENVTEVAHSLLGKNLIVRHNGSFTGGIIVEAEAYCGAIDRASHAYRNKLTGRTRIMFKNGGTAYVYLCYGIHHLFNIVTNYEGVPDAVLIRAIQPFKTFVKSQKKYLSEQMELTNGPGKLSKALGIDMSYNGMDLLGDDIWIEDDGYNLSPEQIVSTKRVGVDYAGNDANLPWRFYIKNNKWISKI